MNLPAFWNELWTAALVNHLWQSTVVVAMAWLLALALRKNHARTRYWVWMTASVKFLIPFALLIDAGQWLRSFFAAPPVAQPALAAAMQQITQPFPQTQFFDAAAAPAPAQHTNLLPALLLTIWACGAAMVLIRWARGCLRIRAAVRAASPIDLAVDVPVLSTPALLEPGIFGIFRPVLLLPAGILNRLTPAQFEAIVAHEMCHMRRRDNLTFAVHMIVEALFWFYPPVWWIGARLIEERERACDEAVVQACGEAEVYAEGILNVCKFCVESPLACAAGVTGANLKKRIVQIMAEAPAARLNLRGKVLLAAMGTLAAAAPLIVGLVSSARISAQLLQASGPLPSFEVAAIKPSRDTRDRFTFEVRGGEFVAQNVPLSRLIRFAYDIKSDRQIENMPRWTATKRFDVDAKIPDAQVEAIKNLPPDQRFEQYQLMLQSLLADRFKLRVSTRMKKLPVYALVVAKSGEEMEAVVVPADPRKQHFGEIRTESRGELKASTLSTARLCQWLSGTPEAGERVVIDDTGLKGRYDFTLRWTPIETGDPLANASNSGQTPGSVAAAESSGPSLFTALEKQLGLKLVPKKAPVEVLVIDHIEQPSPN